MQVVIDSSDEQQRCTKQLREARRSKHCAHCIIAYLSASEQHGYVGTVPCTSKTLGSVAG